MQAPMKVDADSLDRIVRILPISGSMAAFASWNSKMQPTVAQGAAHGCGRNRGVDVPLTGHVARADAGKRQDGGCRERRGEEEHGLVRDQVAAGAHRGSSGAVADGGETGIAAQPRSQGGMTDEAEADRGDDRPEHAACARMQHARSHDDGERRPDRERKRTQTDRHHGEHGNQSCRAYGIDQSSARHLTGQRDQASRGQDQADIELRPGMRGQVDGNEGTEPGLDVREEKGEPVKPARARLRCRSAGRGRRLLRRRRRRDAAIDAAIEPTAVKFQCERGQPDISGAAGVSRRRFLAECPAHRPPPHFLRRPRTRSKAG